MIFHPILGGSAFGIDIKSYASEEVLPSKAKDGTLAVLSESSVGNVYVQNYFPDNPKNKDLWIAFSGMGQIPAIVGSVVLYPLKAYQYLNNTWGEADLRVHFSGVWYEPVADLTLYSYGDEVTDVTGGWYASSALELAKEGTRLVFSAGVVSTVRKFDLTHYSALKVDVQCTSGNSSYIGIGSKSTYIETQTATGSNESSESTRVVDLSGVDGEYYILVQSRSEGSPTYVYRVELIA